jgi:hypothetical protein
MGDSKRSWLHFRLRALFVLLSVSAAASWVYWDGWQRWQWRNEQQDFLSQARTLKHGGLMSEGWRPELKHYGPPYVSEEEGYGTNGGHFRRYVACRWPGTLFVVFWQYKESHCSCVEVFRLPTAPPDYVAQSEHGRLGVTIRAELIAHPSVGREYRGADDAAQLAYKLDFIEMISGDRRDAMGFEYELVYSDPPAE